MFDRIGLKLKIFVGYIILMLLLGFIICLFRKECTKRNVLVHEMKELELVHELARNAYNLMLELSSQSEVISIWNESDLRLYRETREQTCEVLNRLRIFIHVSEQKVRIDSVCLLLGQKEMLLSAVMNTFSELETLNGTVGDKIPAIVSQVRKQSLPFVSVVSTVEDDYMNNVVSVSEKSKKRSFLGGIFDRRKKKSAYRKQQEKEVVREKRNTIMDGNNAAAVRLLYSLSNEVNKKQEIQQRVLLLQMDSLCIKSRILNMRLNALIVDFETMVRQRLEMRYKEIISSREESYNTATVLSFLVFLLAVIIYIFVHRDVNKKCKYRKELEYLNVKNRELLQGRDRMMLAVSHDLRAPLTIIRGYTDEMFRECDIEKRLRCRDAILQSSDSMLAMLNNLLLFYRLNMGKEQPNNILFRLGNIADVLETAYRLQAESKRLCFTVECGMKDIVLLGDRDRILQVGNNLLSNAIKFTTLGSVTLLIRYEAGMLHMEVSDTGTGIPKEQLEGIFLPFERLGNADTQDGFGLGLAIVWEIVELLDGTIIVDSTSGSGTSFRITFPLSLADEESVYKQRLSPMFFPENLCVAVVDNDAVLLSMTVSMFTRYKIRCVGYHSAGELLEAIRACTYDIIITDIRMPGINGLELLELLRTSNVRGMREVPVIAATARVEKYGEEFLKAGFSGYLCKPFSVSELFQVIGDCIKGEREQLLPKVDFSPLLIAEENPKEMLELFIKETEKNMAAFSEFIEKGDRGRLLLLVHHISPVWENLHIGTSVRELRKLLVMEEKTSDEVILSAVKDVLIVGQHAMEQAKLIIETASYE